MKIVSDILKNVYNYSRPKIVNKLEKESVEYHLKDLIQSKNGFFSEKIINSADSLKAIVLTKPEIKYLIHSIRKQYKHEWKSTEFNGFDLINENESKKYLKADHKNTIVNISKPILLRNNEFAFVYFANYCCGNNGQSKLSVYKKQGETWRVWGRYHFNRILIRTTANSRFTQLLVFRELNIFVYQETLS